MIGSFLTRGLVMVFGYAYPAYECFKTMEFNKPDIPQLSFWCQYWIIVATMTVCERIADSFVSWVPMYSEAKLAFYIYLWFPKTRGTTYVYESFFRPMLQQHQNEIDHYLLELKVRAGDTISSYVQKAAGYGQKRFFDILQYVASQSTPAPPRRQNSNKVTQPDAPLNQRSKAGKEQQTEQHPPSPPSGSSSGHEEGAGKDETLANAQKATPTKIVTETIKAQSSSEEQMQIINVQSSVDKCAKPSPPEETVAENAVRVTRARSRKIRPAA